MEIAIGKCKDRYSICGEGWFPSVMLAATMVVKAPAKEFEDFRFFLEDDIEYACCTDQQAPPSAGRLTQAQ